MPLADYNKKRNFKETPEPEGKEDRAKKFRFVVQKHEATRLHYDFRIEHDGVLKSWAVPKGVPALNTEKHLAMMVEDHPLSYYDFEGIIPEGNYGAGSVMVWDLGKYKVPHAETDEDAEKAITAGLEKGEVKLELFGKKLKGLYALVRFKRAGENAWLFIKDKDEFEGAKRDDLHSAKTGKTMKEIKNEELKIKNVEGAYMRPGDSVASSLDKNITPMLATLHDEAFDNKDWLFEPKLDGYRALAFIQKDSVTLQSRNQINLNNKYPRIVTALEKYNFNAVFDGEVVVLDEKGNPSFQLLQEYPETKQGEIAYYIFDLLYLDNLDLRNLPLIERKKALKKLVKDRMYVKLIKFTEEKGEELFKSSFKDGYEGIIAKKMDSIYEAGIRTNNWLKIKNVKDDDFVIGGYTYPEGQRKGFGSLLLGTYKRGKLHYVGNTGSGFGEKIITSLIKEFKPLETDKSPFVDFDNHVKVLKFLKPSLMAKIKYAEKTKDGMLRQAIFQGIRDDKEVKEEVRSKKEEVGNSHGNSEIIKELISHPDKVWFPEKKYTKLDIANYYLEVADFILPYLKNRPQNMNRFPNGIHGESFYHKDYEAKHPKFVKTHEIYSESSNRDINYIVCENVETLLYLVNLGCIEINAWNSRVGKLDLPDFLLFDIDPDTKFSEAVKVSLKLHEILDSLKIPNYIKTSGKRGLHIQVPLEAKYNFDQVRTFSEIISNLVENEMPDIVNLERNPDKRKGKVYIDYLQNRRGQTTASVYSVRPTPDASVSTPLDWSEVNSKLDPRKFTIKNAPARFKEVGDLWKPVLGKGISLEKILKMLK
jgi:bifunctional non-homologous end joining protein LigD